MNYFVIAYFKEPECMSTWMLGTMRLLLTAYLLMITTRGKENEEIFLDGLQQQATTEYRE